ncbi:unnamed protein product [Arabidopsis thaliana]|uniref:Uncharacterized protein n=1 Tax=Arabidopsis thaliana TaxID=3702 RepID=Q9FIE1_ARATH|nr:unnamed protein product [Arabidopsis thaliana]
MIYARENQRSQEAHRWEFLLDCSITIIIVVSMKEFLLSGRCSREHRSTLRRKKTFVRLLLLRRFSALVSLNPQSQSSEILINILYFRRILSFGDGRIFERDISLDGRAKACLIKVTNLKRYVYLLEISQDR